MLKIPKTISMDGWKEVAISDCGEELVLLDNLDPAKITIEPEYFNKKIPGATKKQYLRKGAANRLLQAATILKQYDPRCKILVFDAFRPLVVQDFLFKEQLAKFRVEHPDWGDETLSVYTQKYVSIPSQNPNKPSPHSTGGAIDLSIIKDGKQLEMTPSGFDDASEISRTDYFETSKNPAEFVYRDNRRLLYTCMIEAGFTNYPEEWWHFDYGNQFWGKLCNKKAIYGLVKGGEI